MVKQPNFLLGRGELLTGAVEVPTGGGKKKPPYSFSVAKQRVGPRLRRTADSIVGLPDIACPRDEAVAVVTLHPRYISKSDFPEALLRTVGLRAVGSRPKRVTPEQWGIDKHPHEATTTELFVAGQRSLFTAWANNVMNWKDDGPAQQLCQLEDCSAYTADHKIRAIPTDRDDITLEVVLHTDHDPFIFDSFRAYVKNIDAEADLRRKREVGGLCFIPVHIETANIKKLAQFSFLRVARGMPTLRPLRPSIVRTSTRYECTLPSDDALDVGAKVAVFDGGLPDDTDLSPWVTEVPIAGVKQPVKHFQEHGLAVTSALLFGPIYKDDYLPRPYSRVDFYRVLDQDSGKDNGELYDVLERIVNVLSTNNYEYVNISLGPNRPIEDDDITVWTAELDRLFARPNVLTTVAVGNDGYRDAAAGLNRIQVPSDGVNVLSVGAADRSGSEWARTDYSCVGPGRSPGIIKPDGVTFGGSDKELFFALSNASSGRGIAEGNQGTSLSSPATLRAGLGIRSHLGEQLSPLAIRALLIHRAEPGENLCEVGWGRFITDVQDLITCDDHEVHVVYQGVLPIGKHLRANVPLPTTTLKGKVTIAATFCIATQVDPEHATTYTRSGVEVAFRPHSLRYPKDRKPDTPPSTKTFFSKTKMYNRPEFELREDGKWEPCIRNSQNFFATSLHEPCFDIYYHAREEGAKTTDQDELNYALIVTISSKRTADLYNQVLRAYNKILQPIRPVVQITIHT
jgi:hypothetical protein